MGVLASDAGRHQLIPSKDDRIVAAHKMNARIYSWGQKWDINFEPTALL